MASEKSMEMAREFLSRKVHRAFHPSHLHRDGCQDVSLDECSRTGCAFPIKVNLLAEAFGRAMEAGREEHEVSVENGIPDIDYWDQELGLRGRNVHQVIIRMGFRLQEQRERIQALEGALKGWQPIETAPKDGTAVWVVEPGRDQGLAHPHQTVAYWHPNTAYRSGGFWVQVDTSHMVSPHHWMPLPEPPQETR